jgi:hypothetical protein
MDCEHRELEFIGDEKHEDGVNKYYKCKACGDVIVFTAAGKMVHVKKKQ